jgi:phosphinothricin acetyltransferase
MASIIRLATANDAEQIQAIYAPNVIYTAISFELEPPTVDDMRQRIVRTIQRWPWLVCEHAGEVLGYAYASEHRARAAYQWSVDVSVYVHAQVHRAGIGRALYSSLFKLLALQGFYNAYAGITLPNPGSVGLHESLGFHPIGVYRGVGYKLGAWHDVGWWELTLQAHTVPPEPLKDFRTLRTSPAWEETLTAGLSLLRLESPHVSRTRSFGRADRTPQLPSL